MSESTLRQRRPQADTLPPQPVSKRGPGRPKMPRPAPQPVKHDGIVTEPTVSSHVLELVCDSPMDIKNFLNMFKTVETRDVRMEFKLSGVRISGAGHLKHNFVDMLIDSHKVAQYYCRHNIIMIIDQRNLERIMQKIDKSYSSIFFIAKQDSYMKELNIVLYDQEKGVKEYHTVSLLESSSSVDDNLISGLAYPEYPLSFVLPSGYFKKIISNISKFGQDFTIERRSGVPLCFPYDSNSKTLDVQHTFEKPELFHVSSTLDDKDFLSTTMRIEYIQSLANAKLGDYVKIFVDHEQMTVFKTTLEGGAFTLILAVKIVSYK